MSVRLNSIAFSFPLKTIVDLFHKMANLQPKFYIENQHVGNKDSSEDWRGKLLHSHLSSILLD